jgi:hypothetical protein
MEGGGLHIRALAPYIYVHTAWISHSGQRTRAQISGMPQFLTSRFSRGAELFTIIYVCNYFSFNKYRYQSRVDIIL